MFPATARLAPAYRATAYMVRDGGRAVALRVGAPPPPLRWGGCRRGCVITACNPFSRLRPDAANRRAARRLERVLRGAGLRFAPALACADAGGWPAEPGLLVFGVTRRRGAGIGRIWRQNAILMVTHHDVVLVPLA